MSPWPAGAWRKWRLGEPPSGLFPSRDDLFRLLAVVSIAAAAAAVCSLLTRRPKPFCDALNPPPLDSYGYDSCEPCPKNGRCVNGNLECIEGFKKYRKICIEDGLISQTAKQLSELLEQRICDEHARVLCGEAGKISEVDITNMIDEHLSKNSIGLSEDGFKVAKNRVLENIEDVFETKLTYNKVEFKCPEKVAELRRPLTCQVCQWINRNIIFVATFCILFVGLLCILFSIHQRREVSKRAEQIYEQVCEILEDNAMNTKSGNAECEPWVVASWLRDHLLVSRERRNILLWKKVEELILEDSRIDQYPKLIKGESKVVFEWQAVGSLSAKIKKMRGTRSKASFGGGAVRLAGEMGICVGEVREQSSRGSTHKEGGKARCGVFM